ncbi:MAG TPA: MDR family MFS transporter [Candidatus Limnocylindria bacterium]|nr:MDR family MFS transporter [Candidatus Limnocylindria bacterium]
MTSAATAGATATQPPVQVDRRARFEILGAVMLALFLSALDQTIVGPILPRIVSDLHGIDYYTWVVTAYLLTSTVTVPIYGKLSDLFGRKPMLMVGIGLFLVGSALSGLSQTMWQLVMFRAIQGLGAGALFPISLAVIGDLFTPRERGRYQGLFGAVFGVAFLVGPFLGGTLTDNFSWHWVFYVNLPIGLIALAVIWFLLPTVRRPDASRNIDYLGVATFAAGVVPILVGLTNAQNGDWGSAGVWGLLLIGVVFLAVFIWVESRAKEPMIPLHLFRNRTFAISMVAVFTAMFGFFGAVVFLPLWFQVVQGSSATESGYKLLPFLFGLILSSIASGQIVSRTGHYKWLAAGALTLAAIGVALMTNIRADTPDLVLWSWMFLAGLGIGPSMAVFTIIVQNAVPFSELGAATSDLTLFRQIGGTVGLTLAFTLFRNFLSWDAIRTQLIAAGAPAQFVPTSAPAGFDAGQLTNVAGNGTGVLGQVPAQMQAIFLKGFHEAFSIALGHSMWLGVGALAIAVISVVMLREAPLRHHVSEAEPGQAGHPEGPAPMAAFD